MIKLKKMDLFSKRVIKNLLKRHKTYLSKYFGQNFLINKSVLEKIIKAADLTSKDTVLEIGPGTGNLTQELAKNVRKVIAIEKDRKMIEILKETLKDFKNIQIIQGDILKTNIQNLTSNIQYKVVANLPYYITSPVIRKFLEADEVRPRPGLMVLMVQKEVAQRICASPPKMNLLAVSVQFYGKPEVISFIPKKCFWPKPKVDSAIIKITPFVWPHSHFANQRRANAFCVMFLRTVKAGFSHPRRQLVNNLLALSLQNGVKLSKEKIKTWLLKNKIIPSQRAETLTINDWLNLTKTFKEL